MSSESAHPDLTPAASAHPGLTADEFKLAFRNHPAGVALITADAGDGPVALTASSVFSVSAEPPVLVFSLSDRASASPTILRAGTVVVHMLAGDNLSLAQLGATSAADRFADPTRWSRMATGEPFFPEAAVRIRGEIIEQLRVGESTVVAVHALEASSPEGEPSQTPLVYHNRTWHRLSEDSRIPQS